MVKANDGTYYFAKAPVPFHFYIDCDGTWPDEYAYLQFFNITTPIQEIEIVLNYIYI